MKQLRDYHSGDRVELLRIVILTTAGVYALVLLGFRVAWRKGMVSWGTYLFVLLVVAPICIAVASAAIWKLSETLGKGALRFLEGGRGDPPVPEYSEQSSLIARGRFVEAADSFRDIIADNPTEIEARLRLGELLAHGGRDPEGAEASFLAARELPLSVLQDQRLANALIDLYRASGKREQLKAELARYARRYQHTGAGTDARRHLRDLARQDFEERAAQDPTLSE